MKDPLETALLLREIPVNTLGFVLDYLKQLSSGVRLGKGENDPLPPNRIKQNLLDHGGEGDAYDVFLSELGDAIKTPMDVLNAKKFVERVCFEHALLVGLRAENQRVEDEPDEEDIEAEAITPRPPKS